MPDKWLWLNLASFYFCSCHFSNLVCHWVITAADADNIVHLQFEDFDVEFSEECTKDYLQIHDGKSVILSRLLGWNSYSIIANVLDCDIIVNEFEPQSRNYIHFQINTLRKGMNPLILPLMNEISLHCSSTKLTLALNNPRRLIWH